jgi:hypothetical protein
MADMDQQSNHSRNDPSSRKEKASTNRRIQKVDFEQMNFEQRRAPYNSGRRNIADREYDRPRAQDSPGPQPDGE